MPANTGQGSISFGSLTQQAPTVLPGANEGLTFDAIANEYQLGGPSGGDAVLSGDRFITPDGNFIRFKDGDFQTYIGSDALNAQADDPVTGNQYLSFVVPSGFNSFQNSGTTGNGITAQVALAEIAGIGLRLGITSPNEPNATDKNLAFLEANYSAITAGQENNFQFYSGLDNSAPIVSKRGGWEFTDGQAIGGTLKSRLIGIERTGKATFYDRAGSTGTNEITFDAVTLKQPSATNQNLISAASIVISDTTTITTKSTINKTLVRVENQSGGASTRNYTDHNASNIQVNGGNTTTAYYGRFGNGFQHPVPNGAAIGVINSGFSTNNPIVYADYGAGAGSQNFWFANGFPHNQAYVAGSGDYRFMDAVAGAAVGLSVGEMFRIKRNGDIAVIRRAGFGLATLTTDPRGTIEIVASTGAAGTAPIILNAGTNLAAPVNGAIEFDGTNLYFTVGGVRKTFTLV